MKTKIELDQAWSNEFSFTQKDVNEFAKLTGDTNPLHLDSTYAAQTAFKKPIIHGMLGASVFSKVFGTIFPGPESIYLSQTLDFKKPMFVETKYEARFLVVEAIPQKKRFKVKTSIYTQNTSELVLEGEAWLRIR